MKEYHTTGTTWNPRGVDYTDYSPGTAVPSAAPAPSTAAPAPKAASTAPAASSTAARGNLFAELSKEGEVTKGLKTVTKEQQTWRKEYAGGREGEGGRVICMYMREYILVLVRDYEDYCMEMMCSVFGACLEGITCVYIYMGGWVGSTAPVAAAPRKTVAPRAADKPKGEAKLEYQAGGAKWMVEYQGADNGPVTVTIGDKKETVYILGCVGATVSVVGKCKSIILDGCKKTQLHFDTAFASVECVNCQRIQVGGLMGKQWWLIGYNW